MNAAGRPAALCGARKNTVAPIAVSRIAFRIAAISLALVSVSHGLHGAGPSKASDDLAFLQPWFHLARKDRDTLGRRGVVVRSLPASDRQLSVIATCAVNAPPEALMTSISVGANRDGMVVGRFNTPPRLDDLSALTLDQGDVDRLRQCRPGSCALNLAGNEMSAVQLALKASAPSVHDAFRRVLLDRLRRYQEGGLAALPEYRDRRDPVQPARVFANIIQQIPYLKAYVPAVASYVERFPFAETAAAESSLQWSKVTMNNKPVIMLTHLAAFKLDSTRMVPRVLVSAKQVYASRYMNGELSLTMMFAGGSESSSYLVAISRSDLDELGGALSGLKRSLFENRIEEEATRAITGLRDRLERRGR